MRRTAIAFVVLIAPLFAATSGCAVGPGGPAMFVPTSPEGLAIGVLGGLMQAGIQADAQRRMQQNIAGQQFVPVRMPDGTVQFVPVVR